MTIQPEQLDDLKALAQYDYTDVIRGILDKYMDTVSYSGNIEIDIVDFISQLLKTQHKQTLEMVSSMITAKRDAPPPYKADPTNPIKHVYQNQGYCMALQEVQDLLDNLEQGI